MSDLTALRDVKGCDHLLGYTSAGARVTHTDDSATAWADECDACLALLANAVATMAEERAATELQKRGLYAMTAAWLRSLPPLFETEAPK